MLGKFRGWRNRCGARLALMHTMALQEIRDVALLGDECAYVILL